MFRFIIIIISVVLIQRRADSAITLITPVDKTTEYAGQRGQCLLSNNKVLRYNESYSPTDGEKCVKYVCNEKGYTNIYSCGVVQAGLGCEKVAGDKSLPYPDCCDFIKCIETPKDNQINN